MSVQDKTFGADRVRSAVVKAYRGTVRVRWWQAGGLHAHVTYPDGSWERRAWKAESWWEIDSLVLTLERDYEYVDADGRP